MILKLGQKMSIVNANKRNINLRLEILNVHFTLSKIEKAHNSFVVKQKYNVIGKYVQ